MKKTKILMLLLALASTLVWAQPKSSQLKSNESVATQTKINDEYKDAFNRIDSSNLPGVIADIEQKRAETERLKVFFESAAKTLPGSLSTKASTAGLLIIFPFLMILLIVVAVFYFRYKIKRDRNLLIAKFLDSGKEIPIELLSEPIKPITKRSDLRRGLVLFSFGIAIVIGALIADKNLIMFGLIPLLLGIAYIISHFLIQDKVNN